jgi:electron transfer flavoprotein alpha subunit
MILALVDHDRGELDPLCGELLTFGRSLGAPLQAVLIGETARSLAEELKPWGVSTVHVVEHPRLDEYAPEAWAESVVQLIAASKPQVVTAVGSDRGNEVMAHMAARLDLPMAANCIDAESGDRYLVRRLRWGGSLLELAELDGAVKLLTVAPHGVAGEESAAAGELDVVPFRPELGDDVFRVRLSRRVEPEAGKVSLPEARVVVGGGRGLGSADAFATLDELAELLGGVVGCSRAVTSLGWRPHSDQIGQTGTRIAPDLYIACGISGAIQHMVGCKGAKRILVINTDPQAPILARADYAVICDVREVVPALNEELRKVRQGRAHAM